jgi:hypothetical protein
LTRDKEEHGAPIEVEVPNEITLAQLVAAYIYPFMASNMHPTKLFQ